MKSIPQTGLFRNPNLMEGDLLSTRACSDVYNLIEKLGEGAYGEVWEAEIQRLSGVPDLDTSKSRQRVALKIFHPCATDGDQPRDSLERELWALCALEHSDIVQFKTCEHEPRRNFFYIVMDLIRGAKSITKYCNENRLNIRKRIELIWNICHPVQFANSKRFLHLDIKPENVLVFGPPEHPKTRLIDFSVAHHCETNLGSGPKICRGTFEYMSPEQASGDSRQYGAYSDVYSLGALTFELLVGSPPLGEFIVGAESPISFLERIRTANRPSLDEYLNSLPPEEVDGLAIERGCNPMQLQWMAGGELKSILRKTLQIERGDRYQTVSEFRQDLELFLNQRPVPTHSRSRFYRARKFVVRRSIPLAIAGTVLISCFWAAALSARNFVRERDKDRVIASQYRRTHHVDQMLEELLKDVARIMPGDGKSTDLPYVLDATLDRVDRVFVEDPQAACEFKLQLGQVFYELGAYKKTCAVSKSVLNSLGQTTNNPIGFRSVNQLGRALAALGRWTEAESVLSNVLSSELRYIPPRVVAELSRFPPVVGTEIGLRNNFREWEQALVTLVGTKAALGDVLEASDQAIFHLQDGIAIQTVLFGPTNATTARMWDSLGFARMEDSHESQGAEVDLRLGLRMRIALFGEIHPEVAISWNDLAVLERARGRFKESESFQNNALTIQLKSLPPNHPDIATSLDNLGNLYLYRRDFEIADGFYSRALSIRRQNFGASHSSTATSLFEYFSCLRRQGKFCESKELSESLFLAQTNPTSTEERQLQSDIAAYLVVALLDCGEFQQAADLAKSVYDTRQWLCPGTWRIASIKSLWAAALMGMGSYQEACVLLEESFRQFEENQKWKDLKAEGHLRVREAGLRLSCCLMRLGQVERAESIKTLAERAHPHFPEYQQDTREAVF